MTAIHSHWVPTQKGIADSLGLSRGTVDRALHNGIGSAPADPAFLTDLIDKAVKKVLVHRYRLNSFRMVMEERYPGITIEEVYENHDNEEEAYRQIKGFLSQSRKIDGVYLTTGNGPGGVARALKEAGMEGQVRIVCFDFFPETVKLLKSGLVDATIGEDPFAQGYQTAKKSIRICNREKETPQQDCSYKDRYRAAREH